MTKSEVMLIEGRYKVVIDTLGNHSLYQYDKGGYETAHPITKKVTIKKEGWYGMEKFFPNVRQALSYVIGLEVLEEGDYNDVEGYIKTLRELGEDIGGVFNK